MFFDFDICSLNTLRSFSFPLEHFVLKGLSAKNPFPQGTLQKESRKIFKSFGMKNTKEKKPPKKSRTTCI